MKNDDLKYKVTRFARNKNGKWGFSVQRPSIVEQHTQFSSQIVIGKHKTGSLHSAGNCFLWSLGKFLGKFFKSIKVVRNICSLELWTDFQVWGIKSWGIQRTSVLSAHFLRFLPKNFKKKNKTKFCDAWKISRHHKTWSCFFLSLWAKI